MMEHNDSIQLNGTSGNGAGPVVSTAARAGASARYALITGGAGFIGTNVAHRLLTRGKRVCIFDNLSRPGVEQNLRWLCKVHGQRVQVEINDIRNASALGEAVRGADQVFHLAGQVAVTTSVESPLEDFEINVRGTLNLLEALRALEAPPPLLYTSTNKVYGCLGDVDLQEQTTSYAPCDPAIRRSGIGEGRPLDFHSPYGCSKGAADQYVLDYARIYGLPTVVFRMSCVYGPHQFGTEDQGWVAHFLIRSLEQEPITLYGDGKQVRDVLFVEDLVDAMMLAQENIEAVCGQAFNIGGGPVNATSLLELITLIRSLQDAFPPVRFDAWRPGDQRYYVSDVSRFKAATGWAPRVGVREGIARLYRWLVGARGVASTRLVA